MKKIFTLLFCVVAIGFAANASDLPVVDKCINVLLSNEQPTPEMIAELDANHDGKISIADVTTFVEQALRQNVNVKRTPTKDIDIKALVKETLDSKTGKPNIHDVTDAVDHNLKNHEK